MMVCLLHFSWKSLGSSRFRNCSNMRFSFSNISTDALQRYITHHASTAFHEQRTECLPGGVVAGRFLYSRDQENRCCLQPLVHPVPPSFCYSVVTVIVRTRCACVRDPFPRQLDSVKLEITELFSDPLKEKCRPKFLDPSSSTRMKLVR